MKKLTNQEYINQCIERWGNVYEYDKINYIDSKHDIILICKKHGEFSTNAGSFYSKGTGCKKCANEKLVINPTHPKLDFIKKAEIKHNGKFDYSKVKYQNINTEVIIGCPIHGYKKQTPISHLRGYGCVECAKIERIKKLSITKEQFIEKANILHNFEFDYSEINFLGLHIPVLIRCKKHNIWYSINPQSHLQGFKGCSECSNNGVSKSEKEVSEFIKLIYSEKLIENDRITLNGNELDIYLPECNLAIEFDGLYWHSENYKPRDYHFQKTIDCEAKHIQLIHIFEDEWIEKRKIVESRLRQLIGVNSKRIYARKCYIKQPSPQEERLFLNNNHLQGYVASSVCYGLYYFSKENNKEYLVSLMSFGSLRKNLGSKQQDSVYEMYRFANITNFNIIGGASKLFKHFIKRIKPIQVISFADRRWSSTVRKQTLYDALGFQFQKNTEIGYFYIDGQTRTNRFSLRKDVLVSKGFDSSKTEKEITEEIGLSRIYDCGNLKYVWNK